jgi:uncharacterized protein YdaU (DUF1376 family)
MASRPDTFMPLMVGDYLKDTGHLTTEQHGAYLLLLMAYWARGGALVVDDARLAATARLTPQQWAKHKAVLAEFFVERDGHWVNKRSEVEIKRAHEKMEAKARAGATGANARWQTDGNRIATALRPHKKRNGKTDADAMAKRCPSPSPSHKVSQERGETLARPPEISDFDRFWEAYPHQAGDPETGAIAAWESLESSGELPKIDDLIAAVNRWKAARKLEKDPPFAPFAKTWLAEKRWLDWPEPAPPEPHKRDWADAYPDTWARLKARLTPNEWAFWLGKCTINGPAHVLYTPDELTRDRVEAKYRQAISSMFGDKGSVRVLGQPQQEVA